MCSVRSSRKVRSACFASSSGPQSTLTERTALVGLLYIMLLTHGTNMNSSWYYLLLEQVSTRRLQLTEARLRQVKQHWGSVLGGRKREGQTKRWLTGRPCT